MRNRQLNKGEYEMLKRTRLVLAASVVALTAVATPVRAQGIKVCQRITGTATETIVPPAAAPNDPFGRVIGTFTGDFGGATNGVLSAFLASPPVFSSGGLAPVQTIQERHVFLTGPGDTVITSGTTSFNIAPNVQPGSTQTTPSRCPAAPCVVQVPQSLEITGGSGRWAGASGKITAIGIGDIDLTQGQAVFTLNVRGEICIPANRALSPAKE
jgi:hypothetical protein